MSEINELNELTQNSKKQISEDEYLKYLDEITINDPQNLAIMDVECGKVVIELYPQISPKSVKRFKYFV